MFWLENCQNREHFQLLKVWPLSTVAQEWSECEMWLWPFMNNSDAFVGLVVTILRRYESCHLWQRWWSIDHGHQWLDLVRMKKDVWTLRTKKQLDKTFVVSRCLFQESLPSTIGIRYPTKCLDVAPSLFNVSLSFVESRKEVKDIKDNPLTEQFEWGNGEGIGMGNGYIGMGTTVAYDTPVPQNNEKDHTSLFQHKK